MDNTRSGSPETNVVLGARCGKEVINLLVDVNRTGKILSSANLCLNQMITVDSGRIRDGGHASGHELKNSHLSSGILASYTIWSELEVGDTSLELLVMRVVEMGVEDLLGVHERAIESLAYNCQVFRHLLVVDEVVVLVDILLDLAVERVVSHSSHTATSHLGSCPQRSSSEELSRRQHGEWSG